MTDTNPDARGVGAETRDEAGRATHRVADDARNLAHEASERARGEAYAQGDRAKAGVASEMSGIAEALRKAAGDMRSGSPQERTIGQLAGSLADASDAIRDRDLGELASELSGFARRNPAAFLGGAALAGFAATRFAKASASTARGKTGFSGDGTDAYGRHAAGATPTMPAAGSGTSPGSATQPVTTTEGTGAVTAPGSTTTPYSTGER